MIIASKEAPLNPLDDAPDFEADHDYDLIVEYLDEIGEIDMRSECAELCNDAFMLRAFLAMRDFEFDLLAEVCLPAAVYAKSLKEQLLIKLRNTNIRNKEIAHANGFSAIDDDAEYVEVASE